MKRVDISGFVGLIVLISAFTLAMQNSLYVILAYAVLLVIISLTWRLYMPNVFTFIMGYHWLQVVAYIFYVNSSWHGDMGLMTKSSVPAFLYSLTGLIVMSFVFSEVAYKNLQISLDVFREALERMILKKYFIYTLSYMLSLVF